MEQTKQTCHRCGKQYSIEAQICPFCGAPIGDTLQDITIGSVSVTARLNEPALIERPARVPTTLVGKQAALYVEDASAPLIIDLSERVTLGRRSPRDTGISPTIALNRFDAFNRGISRIHAALYYENDTVMLVDEYSTNGTWVNGRKIEPMQPTPLHNGDEIRLARLRIMLLLHAPTADNNHKPKT
ncbi:MAG: FHA domain-containing protein [Aggregatilineales bacterium]